MTRILIFAPHPDDAELGMGGSIARFVRDGHDVMVCDLTDGEPTPHGSPEIRARETAEATRILGVKRVNLGLRNRFVQHTIESRHAAAGVIRAHRAEVIFTPYFEDAHPDHLAGTRIVEDARFDAKLTGIEMPTPNGLDAGPPVYAKWLFYYYATHLRITPVPSFCVDVSGFEEAKRRAILAYHSQFIANEKNRGVVEWIDASLRFFGSRIGTAGAEPFFSREPIGLAGLGGLVT